MDYTLNLTRGEICKLMLACTEIWLEMDEEMKSAECDEYRKDHVLPESIKMWRELHDKLESQLDEQDKNQDWYVA